MLDYKKCSIGDFNAAMKMKDADVTTISDAHLYILYTKFKSDAFTCFRAGTIYSNHIGGLSENRAKVYKKELQDRGITI